MHFCKEGIENHRYDAHGNERKKIVLQSPQVFAAGVVKQENLNQNKLNSYEKTDRFGRTDPRILLHDIVSFGTVGHFRRQYEENPGPADGTEDMYHARCQSKGREMHILR
jgi:hypothetical protein